MRSYPEMGPHNYTVREVGPMKPTYKFSALVLDALTKAQEMADTTQKTVVLTRLDTKVSHRVEPTK